jgi:hypothetical protein
LPPFLDAKLALTQRLLSARGGSQKGCFRMVRPDFSKIKLCKYLSPEGAKKSLPTRTIKLSKPCTFNDPFDTRLDEIFGRDFKKFAEDLKTEFLDFLIKESDVKSPRSGEFGTKLELLKEILRNASPEKIEYFRNGANSTAVEQLYDIDAIKKTDEEVLKIFKLELNRYGVFCTTLKPDSLLMWAHYAQSHEGAVLRFAPDLKKDSVLCASEPVRYANDRPLLYRTAADLLRHGITMSSEESAKKLLHNLIFTKSPDWEYEEEFRLERNPINLCHSRRH